jgi:hypothetical protein
LSAVSGVKVQEVSGLAYISAARSTPPFSMTSPIISPISRVSIIIAPISP